MLVAFCETILDERPMALCSARNDYKLLGVRFQCTDSPALLMVEIFSKLDVFRKMIVKYLTLKCLPMVLKGLGCKSAIDLRLTIGCSNPKDENIRLGMTKLIGTPKLTAASLVERRKYQRLPLRLPVRLSHGGT